jgi:ABC-type multidrug transport system ATPase subunit
MSSPSSQPPAALELRGIVKAWRGQPVLDGVDFLLTPGAVTWLGGSNGAGKTTLMRIASGLIAPEAGTVSLDGLDPWKDRREYQRRIGVVPAGNGGLYARLSVADNLDFQAGLGLVRRADRRPSIERAVAAMDLGELAPRRVDRLSMGQRQRVRLALALLHDPAVLLLDEPYTSLDEEGLELLQGVMDGLAQRGGAALWLGPNPTLAGLRHDRALWVADGRIEDRTGVPA